ELRRRVPEVRGEQAPRSGHRNDAVARRLPRAQRADRERVGRVQGSGGGGRVEARRAREDRARARRLPPAAGVAPHDRGGGAAAALKRDAREKIARGRADSLAPKLSLLTIAVVSTDPKLEVRRDDVAVGSAEWGIPIPVDPGKHTITASAPGHRPWSTAVQI